MSPYHLLAILLCIFAANAVKAGVITQQVEAKAVSAGWTSPVCEVPVTPVEFDAGSRQNSMGSVSSAPPTNSFAAEITDSMIPSAAFLLGQIRRQNSMLPESPFFDCRLKPA